MIFDNEGLAEARLEIAGEQAGSDVSGTAGPEGNNDPDWVGWIICSSRL
jgi:nicotinamide mononucleotide (NMN) deamidase PncC